MILGMMGLLATRAFMQASLSSVPPHLPLSRALSQLAAGGEVGNQVGNQGHPQPSAVASATPSAAGSAAVHEGSESQDGQPDAKTFAQGQGLDTPAAEPQGLAFHSAYASPPEEEEDMLMMTTFEEHQALALLRDTRRQKRTKM